MHSLIPAVCRVLLLTPCPILTTVCSFYVFSPRERTLSWVSINSFIPAAFGWTPGMTSISRGSRIQYIRSVIGVLATPFATLRDVLVTTVSLYVAVAARIGNGAVDPSRRECGGSPFEASAQFFPLSTTRWPSFVAFLQPVSEGVSPSIVSAAIRFHEPDVV